MSIPLKKLFELQPEVALKILETDKSIASSSGQSTEEIESKIMLVESKKAILQLVDKYETDLKTKEAFNPFMTEEWKKLPLFDQRKLRKELTVKFDIGGQNTQSGNEMKALIAIVNKHIPSAPRIIKEDSFNVQGTSIWSKIKKVFAKR